MYLYSEVVWNTWIWTSDIRGAGTDSNVFMVLYGTKGKTDVVSLKNKSDNFEQGELDKFKVYMSVFISRQARRQGEVTGTNAPLPHAEKFRLERTNLVDEM